MTMTEQPTGWPTGRHPSEGACPSCAESAGHTGARPAEGDAENAGADPAEAPARVTAPAVGSAPAPAAAATASPSTRS
ncbi:hypothetical protein ACE14D_27570, partial [Streptomyces sp. Act-28]